MTALARALATWFGCGYAPKGPGTAGSLGAIVPAWLAGHYLGWPPLAIAALGLAIVPVGVWAANVLIRQSGLKDPQQVVIDEVAGQWIACAGASHLGWIPCAGAFVLFRLFDIWKPWPVRRAEALPGGLGVMADDVLAGVYAALVLWAAGWFNR